MAVPPISAETSDLFRSLIEHHLRFTLAKRRIQLSKARLVSRHRDGRARHAGREDARDRGPLRAPPRQETLLPLAGVPDRPLAREQPLQPRHHRHLPRVSGRNRHRPATALRRRTRRRAGQRRPRPAGRLLSRFARHPGYARLRLRHQLRIRPVPPGNPRRLPDRTPRQLAARDLAVAGRAPRGYLPDSGLWPHRTSHRPRRRIQARCGSTGGCSSACPPTCRSSATAASTVNYVRLYSAGARRTNSTCRSSTTATTSRRSSRRWSPRPSPRCSIRPTRCRPAANCGCCRNTSSSPAPSAISSAASCRRATTFSDFPAKVAIQLNDTHPALAVAELMRLLRRRVRPAMGSGLGDHPRRPSATPITP